MLERLAGHEYYYFLDRFSRYFQIPIALEDHKKTTFTCPYGTFAYKRMPFGLCNALATFQRCMTTIFHELIEDSTEVFMDDFSVFGNSFDHCLKNLEKMLKRCEETNLVLNREKCHFMIKEGIVLGHKVFGAGIEDLSAERREESGDMCKKRKWCREGKGNHGEDGGKGDGAERLREEDTDFNILDYVIEHRVLDGVSKGMSGMGGNFLLNCHSSRTGRGGQCSNGGGCESSDTRTSSEDSVRDSVGGAIEEGRESVRAREAMHNHREYLRMAIDDGALVAFFCVPGLWIHLEFEVSDRMADFSLLAV
ncbi:RNA-directed DNA polymerase [Tanacetum coccineum]